MTTRSTRIRWSWTRRPDDERRDGEQSDHQSDHHPEDLGIFQGRDERYTALGARPPQLTDS